jgi:putative transposase
VPQRDSGWPQRHSIRLKGYDYAQPGAYFVTISTHQGEPLFGEVVDGAMRANECGEIVRACWDAIPMHFPDVETDAFVVMPNHVHGVIIIRGGSMQATHACTGAACCARTTERPNVAPGSLGAVVRSFKSACTKRINALRGTPGAAVWHRNYYERVIRNERELNAICEYILNNPARWAEDEENPGRAGC